MPPDSASSSNQESETSGPGAGDQSGGNGQDEPSNQPSSISQDNHPDGQGERNYSSVYDPRRVGGNGGPQIVLEPDAGNSARLGR